MAVELSLKQTDTAPELSLVLEYGGTTAVIPEDSTGVLRMRALGEDVPLLEAAVTLLPIVLSDDTTTYAKVVYQWLPEDTLIPGRYNAEVQVTYPDDRKQTFPGDGYYTIDIIRNLAE